MFWYLFIRLAAKIKLLVIYRKVIHLGQNYKEKIK